jgi:hypothetical protein
MRHFRSMFTALSVVALFTLAGPSVAAPGFNQGFETDNSGWNDFGGSNDAVRVPSGTNGVPSASGSFHAVSSTTGGAAGRLGGYSCCFPQAGFTVSVDVYLDFALADGADRRFNYSVAINGTTCAHLSDFVVSLGTRPGIPGEWIASASQNCPGWPSNPGRNPQAITSGTGWYTMKYIFKNEAGFLDVDVEIKNSAAVTVAYFDVSTLYNPGSGLTPIPISVVSGHRYAWFCAPESGAGYVALPFIAFDNSIVSPDECATPAIGKSWGAVKGMYR